MKYGSTSMPLPPVSPSISRSPGSRSVSVKGYLHVHNAAFSEVAFSGASSAINYDDDELVTQYVQRIHDYVSQVRSPLVEFA